MPLGNPFPKRLQKCNFCITPQASIALWRQGLIDRVLNDPDTPRNIREAALLIKSPEMVKLHCRRAKGKAATHRAGLDVLRAVQTVLAWTA